MPDLPIIAKLRVDATLGGASYSVESLRVKLGINTLATATLVGIKSAEPIKFALAPDVMAEARSRQQTRMSGRLAPDVTVTCDDGVGGSLKFTGFMTAPVLEISKNSIGDQMSVIAEDALLDGLDLSIYTVGVKSTRVESDQGPMADAFAAAAEGDALAMLAAVTDVLVGTYEESLAAAGSDSARLLIEQQHGLNTKKPLEIWHGLLGNGTAIFTSWKDAVASAADLRRVLAERAGSMLQQQASGFWQVMNGMMAAFKLHYVPSTDGRGRLTLSDARVGEPTRDMDVHATSVSVTDGSVRIMQPGGVVMLAPSTQRMRNEANQSTTTDPGTIAGQYPNPLLDGYIHREPPPFWLIGPDGYPVVAFDSQAPAASSSVNYDLEHYAARQDDANKRRELADTHTSSIMNELCRIVFEQIRLADSTATLTTNLDFTIKVGERVRFKFEDGVSFVGFIDNLMHSIDLTEGKRLNSFTQLGITHIEY